MTSSTVPHDASSVIDLAAERRRRDPVDEQLRECAAALASVREAVGAQYRSQTHVAAPAREAGGGDGGNYADPSLILDLGERITTELKARSNQFAKMTKRLRASHSKGDAFPKPLLAELLALAEWAGGGTTICDDEASSMICEIAFAAEVQSGTLVQAVNGDWVEAPVTRDNVVALDGYRRQRAFRENGLPSDDEI